MNGASKAKKIAYLSVITALALVLSYLESLFPPLVAVPGVKVGLANIAVVFALYKLGFSQACTVSVLRVFLVSVLFGSAVSLSYSGAGAVVSLLGMFLLKRSGIFSVPAVSISGAVLHNLAQTGIACIMLDTSVLKYYIPVLLLTGIAAGVIIGLVAAVLIERVDVQWEQ